MNTQRIVLLIFLGLAINASGQLSKNFKDTFMEAEYCYMEENYQKALYHFDGLLNVDPDNYNINFLCGACCLKIPGESSKAIGYLEKAIMGVDPSRKRNSYKKTEAPPEVYLLLAKAYHQNEKFTQAIQTYEMYRDHTGTKKSHDIESINRLIKSCELAMSMVQYPLKVEFQNVGDQSQQKYPTSNPVVSGNDSLLIYLVNHASNQSVMMTRLGSNGWSSPRTLNIELAITGDFYPVSLSYDGTELYLVRKDYFDSQIFVSHYEKGRWGRAKELNNNINTRDDETHACLSKDGTNLFFTSARKGGYGGLDIYRSVRNSEGDWGEPVNLGPAINTMYNEETPFLTKEDTILYFSSEGHQTMGGFDIFYAEREGENSWSSPLNVGYPINTSSDNKFYNPGWNDQYGYYTCQIKYQAITNIKTVHIQPLVDLTSKEEWKNQPETSDEIATDERAQHEDKANDSEPTTEPGCITLNNIMFAYNEYKLNAEAISEVEKILNVMKEIPESTIELTGHTDSKGSCEYNKMLSAKRAQSVSQYLIKGGISSERIVVKGNGESSPVAINKYMDGSDAPRGRLLNRYTAIKILNLPDNLVQIEDIFVPEELRPIPDFTYPLLMTEYESMNQEIPVNFHGKKVSMVISPEEQQSRISYTIQFMALKKHRDVSYFDQLGTVMKYIGKDGMYRYTFGKFQDLQEARKAMTNLHEMGYKNAFITSIKKCEDISVNQGSAQLVAQKQ